MPTAHKATIDFIENCFISMKNSYLLVRAG
jgi:hypothetical protein